MVYYAAPTGLELLGFRIQALTHLPIDFPLRWSYGEYGLSHLSFYRSFEAKMRYFLGGRGGRGGGGSAVNGSSGQKCRG